ncbi:MAG: RdgB/HAM1 family non-canonical purine NTP pyrophosphatase [Candidatus Eisenbacteria bacterium]|nr:RdgB/HAM1 family non-canonical purine NTP pyrophosphatase [Candidatus Eisenbacteria bacterium]
MRFVLATFNPDKAREMTALLARPEIEIVPLADWPGAASPEETGETLLENARLKARAAMALTGLPAIADDTGLEVDALGGAPGARAARYAGPQARSTDNVAKLLHELGAVPEAGRAARFRTTCVACFPGGREIVATGVLEGRIGREPAGTNGFGYDPVFVLPDGRTLAQLGAAEKNVDSHRARAIRALAARL